MTATAVRPAARGSPRVIGLLALVAGGTFLGLLATGFKVADGTHPWWDVALSVTSGFGFLLAGSVAAARQPDNRTGHLMVLTGVAVFAEDVQLSTAPLLHTMGLLLRASSTALFCHLLLAFPTGGLMSRVDRVIVVLAYVWSFVVMPSAVPFQTTPVPNLLQVADAPLVTEVVGRLGLPLAVATLLVLVHRWYLTRPQLRYVLTPVVVLNVLLGVAALGAALTWGDDFGLYRLFVTSTQVIACLLPLAFLAGVLRIRLGRSEVSRLIEELGRPVDPAALRDLLSQALGDPSLVVGYRRDAGGELVDADGRVLTASQLRRVATSVRHAGREVGALLHDPALLDDDHVLRAVAAAAGIAMENQRLQAELRAQLDEVRRSRARIVAAEQEERARIERDLHDGVQAQLVAALIFVRHAAVVPGAAPSLQIELERAAVGLEQGLADLRRITHGIRPAALAEAGLVAAVQSLLDSTGLITTLGAPVEGIGQRLEDTIYFLVNEAVVNTVKHAGATRLVVDIRQSGPALTVTVADDGRGGAVATERGGLQGMQDRVMALGGRLELASPAGGGTTVVAQLPRGLS